MGQSRAAPAAAAPAAAASEAAFAHLCSLGEAAAGGGEEEAGAAAAALADVARQPGGAAALEQSGAVELLLEAVHGQRRGGLTAALLAAVSGALPPASRHSLDALAECARRAPQCRGRIAGSGVLGLVSALMLSPRSDAGARALALRAVAALVADDAQLEAQGGAARREEFAALRGQLLKAGVVAHVCEALGAPWDGEAPLEEGAASGSDSGSDDCEEEAGIDAEALNAAEPSDEVSSGHSVALVEAACDAVVALSGDERVKEPLKEHQAAARCLGRLPAAHAAAALAALARSRAAGAALASEAAIGRLLATAAAGNAAARRETTAALAATLEAARGTAIAAVVCRRAVAAGAPSALHRLVTLGGAATAAEAAGLVAELARCGGEETAHEVMAARLPAALAGAAPADGAVAVALVALAEVLAGPADSQALADGVVPTARAACERLAALDGSEGEQGAAALRALGAPK